MDQHSHQQGRSIHDDHAVIPPEAQVALLNTLWQVHKGKKHDEEEESDAEEEEEDEDLLVALIVAAVRQCIEYNDEDEEEEEDAEEVQIRNKQTTINRKRSRTRAKQVMVTDDGMRQRPYTPKSSHWYNLYVAFPDLDDKTFHRKFRARFRLPYEQFTQLLSHLEMDDRFRRWHNGSANCIKKEATPMSLLLLCSLRYLGRGWTFDDLSENTAISQEVIRTFFHEFISYGSTVLYDKYVRTPLTSADASSHMHEYSSAGFPGAVGSTDATHIMLERVNYRFRQAHLGFKMAHTARTYNITVNHRRRILATTQGHPARWNDKTLALFDDFMQRLHHGDILDDVIFELYDCDINGRIFKRRYQGAWLLVDNGYLAHSTTVPPIKTTIKRSEIRFSAWLESMRKDVECTFGILKGRWRILKTGIRLFGVKAADEVFLTCCALHNWLLEIDGLDDEWQAGVAGYWEQETPTEDDCDYDDTTLTGGASTLCPDAVWRLRHPTERRNYDSSGMGPGEDVMHDDACVDTYIDDSESTSTGGIDDNNAGNVDTPILVRNLKLHDFRQKLVTHFDIAFKKNELQWPRRLTRCQPPTNI